MCIGPTLFCQIGTPVTKPTLRIMRGSHKAAIRKHQVHLKCEHVKCTGSFLGMNLQ